MGDLTCSFQDIDYGTHAYNREPFFVEVGIKSYRTKFELVVPFVHRPLVLVLIKYVLFVHGDICRTT